ncbi:MAG TPA: type II toxin-antitoxin system RelE/ParE family toxin [Phycisphaerales bacterium]|nr:type II toxin-antitoxin system RelE/ParE family toxin [Phycisphaerales bacterium]
MAEYRITIKKSAAKELEDIPRKNLRRIVKRIRALAEDPRPQGSQKLSGQEHFRVRQGDYRIVYSVDDEDSRIDIVKIGHRREVYR